MKTQFTHIAKTVATNSSVEIDIQHKDTDEGYDHVTLRVVPTDHGVIFVIGGLGDKLPIQRLSPSNHVELVWTDEKEARRIATEVQFLKCQLRDKDRDYERLFLWLRTALNKPNGFQLWADHNKANGRDPITLILKGEKPDAIKAI